MEKPRGREECGLDGRRPQDAAGWGSRDDGAGAQRPHQRVTADLRHGPRARLPEGAHHLYTAHHGFAFLKQQHVLLRETFRCVRVGFCLLATQSGVRKSVGPSAGQVIEKLHHEQEEHEKEYICVRPAAGVCFRRLPRCLPSDTLW